MSNTRGIFESYPNQPDTRTDSPFAVVQDQAAEVLAPASPFTAVARQESPFTVVDDSTDSRQVESGKPAKVPERRKLDGPFQVAEPSEGFGFEAPPKAFAASPFEAVAQAPAAAPASSPFANAPSPFSTAAQAPASPFSVAPPAGPSPTTQAALAAFNNWQEPASTAPTAMPARVEPVETVTPAAFIPAASQFPSAFSQPAAPQQAAPFTNPPFSPAPATVQDDSYSDSFSIRQLELRAIFGVDREMTADEILQRARALPGMKNISRVAPKDVATIEAMKILLPNLGFGSGGLKLYAGSVPLEFIREGPVMLAVQTDGGFAPGVRETLMIVARELGRSF